MRIDKEKITGKVNQKAFKISHRQNSIFYRNPSKRTVVMSMMYFINYPNFSKPFPVGPSGAGGN